MKYSILNTTFLLIITGSVLLFCVAYSSCQSQEKNASRFGIKGGINFSNLYSKDADNTDILTGFNIGVFGKMPIAKSFYIQPELYFTTKGAEVIYDNSFVDGTARFSYNYVEMPILLAVNITDKFNVHAGPYVAYMISGKVENESNINLFDFEDNIDTHDYNRLDAGIALGAGIDIGSIGLGARYNYGLTKVGKERTFLGTDYTFPDARNGVLNFYISFSLN